MYELLIIVHPHFGNNRLTVGIAAGVDNYRPND